MTDRSGPKRPKEDIRLYRLTDLPTVELFQGTDTTRSVSRHRHWFFSIGVIEKGNRVYYYRGKEHLAGRGDIKVICPGEVHASWPADQRGYTSRSVRLEAEYFNSLVAHITREDWPLSSFFQTVIHDNELYRQVIKLYQVLAGNASRLEKETLLVDTLRLLISKHAPAEPAGAEDESLVPVRAISEYLDVNFGENISLLDLSRQFGVSPFHLVRQFTREIGIPPHRYQVQTRFVRALELLAAGNPVAAVAAETGFFDQSHFTRAFKKKFGVTPNQYRADSSRPKR
ncbi:MAG: AraC family transcriptional regulator [Firmicutes bacterium]|nr:AraC family transcriptional regulator [Bacillota bacterium]